MDAQLREVGIAVMPIQKGDLVYYSEKSGGYYGSPSKYVAWVAERQATKTFVFTTIAFVLGALVGILSAFVPLSH